MRLFSLILISVLCQSIQGQILPGMAQMENFDPYRPISGRLEYYPDSLNPQSVREFDSTGRCVRHAEGIMKDGKWVIHGQDTLWAVYSVSVFTVIENIPHGPFHFTYSEDFGEGGIYCDYAGEYRNGLLHGKLKSKNGSFFHYENGLLQGSYLYREYWTGVHEKGRFEKGFRHGKVLISNNRAKIQTLECTNGYLRSVVFLHTKNNIEYFDYQDREYSRFAVFSDTLGNTIEIIKYNLEGDTVEIQQHFEPVDIRSSQVYENNEVFNWEYTYSPRDKPRRLRIEDRLGSPEYPPGTFAKQISSSYPDRTSDDSLFWVNSTVLQYYRDRKNNYFYYNEQGAISEVRYSYQTYHNPVSCLYGLKDLWGEWVLKPEYEEIAMAYHLGFIVKKEGRFGLYNWDGKELIAPELEELMNFDRSRHNIPIETVQGSFSPLVPGRYLARIKGKWGLVDHQGNWLIPAAYDKIYALDSFVTASRGEDHFIWKLEKGKYILFDQAFEEILFYQIPFSVKHGQKWGILGRDFKWILPPEYDHLESGQRGYIAGKHTGPKQMNYWVLNARGQRIHEEPLIARPVLHPEFIKTVGADFGIMTYQGKILANTEYSRVDNIAFKTDKQGCSTLVYRTEKEGKHYLIDTNGNRSGAFESLLLIAPYTENVSYWGTSYSECPEVLSFLIRNGDQYRIIHQQGGTLLDESILGEKIDSAWVIGTIAFVRTPKKMYFYFSHDGRVFNQGPAKVSELFYYSGITRHNNECVIRIKDHHYGLIDSWTGEWLLKPDYQSIEKRGDDYVLRDTKGKLSFYKRGADNSWQALYSMRYPVNTENYIVYSHAGRAGLMKPGGMLLIDTLYQGMTFQTSFRNTWYWAEKEESGVWDVYASDGKMVYSNIRAASGSVLENGDLMITTKEGKMVLLNPQKKEIIRADRILSQDHNLQEFLFKEGKVWGRYNRLGHFSHPARYEKIWPFRPFYVMDKGIPGQLDSAGNLAASLTISAFLNTSLPQAGHRYFSFCRSGDYEKPDRLDCSLDSLQTWQSNLLFMLRSNNDDITNYAPEQPSSFRFTQVLISGETKESPPSVHFLDYNDNGNRFHTNGYVSFYSEHLLSTFFVTNNMSERGYREVETYTYSYKDSVLKKLRIADFVEDEKALELLLLKGLAEKNLPVEVCPDLKRVYALNENRFFLDETGITFLIEVSYQEVYLPVKIPYSDMMDILRKDVPVYQILVGE